MSFTKEEIITSNEIKKACKDCLHYEACKGTYSSAKGDEDILYDFDGEMYANSGCEDFQDKDLINRLQAENKDKEALLNHQGETIKTLENVIKNTFLKNAGLDIDPLAEIKAEAYKEFAEKANEIIDLIVDLMFDDSVSKCQLPNCHKPSSIPCENEICIQENKEYWHSKLDNLLKEKVSKQRKEDESNGKM